MAPPQGSASYKKQDGLLAISKDQKAVSWTPNEPGDAPPSLVISAGKITNLQQTPETSAKVMLKIFTQEKDQTEPIAHVFNFTSTKDARGDANAIKAALSTAIQAAKTALDVANATASGSSAAMAIASAVSGGSKGGNLWDDDEKLKADIDLQQSLMREDPALQRTLLEATKTRPDTISLTKFTNQFWASRIHLLRAHAILKSQRRGTYNVFSTLKPTIEGPEKKLSLSADHVRLIFAQYPLVLRVYDKEVPKRLEETKFWSRFFQSKLYKKLRGEKINNQDALDGILDQYLDAPEFDGREAPIEARIPRMLDMEGNEENHSQRKGNRPDIELRPRSLDKVPIIRTLNTLSEKLMSHVPQSDIDPSQPIGMDEATYNQLRLRDLAGDPEQNRTILKVRDQSHFFAQGKQSTKALSLLQIDPTTAITTVSRDLATTFPQPGAGVLLANGRSEIDTTSTSELDETDPSAPVPPSTTTLHLRTLITTHRNQTSTLPPSSGLSETTYSRLILVHATTTEFLSQFWSAFLSGDPSRAPVLAALVDSLHNAEERIRAVAAAAEEERDATVRAAKRAQAEHFARTKVKRRIDYRAIGGGAEVVERLLAPTRGALDVAVARYGQAFREQMAAQGGLGGLVGEET